MAWLAFERINLSLDSRHIRQVLSPDEAPSDCPTLVSLVADAHRADAEQTSDDERDYALDLRGAGVFRTTGATMTLVDGEDVSRYELPELVADHLRALGVVAIAQYGSELAYVIDPRRLAPESAV